MFRIIYVLHFLRSTVSLYNTFYSYYCLYSIGQNTFLQDSLKGKFLNQNFLVKKIVLFSPENVIIGLMGTEKNDRYLINDKPIKAIWIFALPLIIGNFFQQTYTMVDSMVVGRYVSSDALAAIGASYAFTNIFIWIAGGGGIGASVIASRYFGNKKYKLMKTSIYSAMIAFLVFSVIMALVGLLVGRPVMMLLRTPESVLDEAVIYLNIYFCGLPFLFMYNIISAMFNAIGKSKIPLYFLIFSSVFNIGLDIFMVRILHMGIAGVAWATLVAQGLSAIISFFALLRIMKTFYEDDPEEKVSLFSAQESLRMAGIALPSILQQATVAIGMMLVQSVVNGFGPLALAGFSAAARVENFVAVPWSAFNNAMSTYTAQNLGAGQKQRVRQGYIATNKLIMLFGLGFFVILELFAGNIIRLFLGENITETALSVGCGYITFLGLCSYLLGLKMSVDGMLRGAADTKAFTIANLVNLALRVLISFTLAPIYGVAFVWIASPIGWAANWLISYAHYRKTDLAKG